MSTSSSFDFSVNRDELIKASLRLIGVGVTGETPTATEISDASEALNLMLKAWQADGLQLWKRSSQSITLTASTSSYTLGPTGTTVMQRPLRILQAVRKDTDSNEVPLQAISQNEYWELANKTDTGVPNAWYYDPQLTNGVLYIWNPPGTSEASEYTVEILYHKPYEDMDAGTNDFDFPVEWLEAIKYGLAIRLAPEYGYPMQERYWLSKQAEQIKKSVMDWDQEYTSIIFEPDYQGRF